MDEVAALLSSCNFAPFRSQVLTPLQFGRAAVQSYPFYVDGLAIADLLSSDGKLSPGAVGSSSSAFGALVQVCHAGFWVFFCRFISVRSRAWASLLCR